MKIDNLKEFIGENNFEFYPNFISENKANQLFEYLKNQKDFWIQHQIKFKDRISDVPRLVKWFGDMNYKYSGINNPPCKMDEVVEKIMLKINEKLNLDLNSCLLNYYRHGSDSISLHKDDERELGKKPLIAVLSVGAEREFIIKEEETKKQIKIPLKNGSLFIMKNNFNRDFFHGIDKIRDFNKGRISLTYRKTLDLNEDKN